MQQRCFLSFCFIVSRVSRNGRATVAAKQLVLRRQGGSKDGMELEREKYRTEIDGKTVDLYTIKNTIGMVVKITNWGAKVQQILVANREGKLGDVALGYDSIGHLQAGQSSMGAFIGRYANRIGQAKFILNGHSERQGAPTCRQRWPQLTARRQKGIAVCCLQCQAARRRNGADDLRVQGRRGRISGHATTAGHL
jgi:Aldose 1-epimerase